MALNAIVVSDSTTLITLINIKKFEILFKFSDTIMIAKAVYDEVSIRLEAKNILKEYINQGKVIVQNIDNYREVKILLNRLDLGESESIVLAANKKIPLIIDEKKGKSIAKSLGLDTIGLIGILLLFKEKELLGLNEIENIVEMLQKSKFRVSTSLLELLLK